MPTWAVLLIVFGCMFVGCMTMCGIAASSGSGTGGTVASGDATAPQFVKTRIDTCSRYTSAPNEIKKSAIFKEYRDSVGAYSVDGLSGKLSTLETSHGGGKLHLVISTPSAKFEETSIDKSSPVYSAVSEMTVGDSVTFKATNVHPNYSLLTSEQFFVCSDYWGTDFISVQKH